MFQSAVSSSLWPLVLNKNYDSSCGLFINLEKPVQEDCVIVQVLKKQGAIPFVKTNIPQGLLRLMIFKSSFKVLTRCHNNVYTVLYFQSNIYFISSYDCSNPIYGQTLNPHNLQKTSGGSSGGEGALIGGGGSLLGMGSDIGGSIRIPASFCGIYGFKPTPRRLRYGWPSNI